MRSHFVFLSFSLYYIRLARARIVISITLKFFLKTKRFSNETWKSVTKHFIHLKVLTGLITALSPMWSTKTGLFVYSSIFGFISGSYGFIRTGVSQLLGKELFSTSFSWFLLLEGIGMCLGPTIGGDFRSLKENLYIFTSSNKICF